MANKLTINRADKRLKKYRPDAEAVFHESKAPDDRRCRVELNGRTVIAAATWEDACELAVLAWEAEDKAKKINPKAFACYGNNTYNWCQLCIPGMRSGTVIVAGYGEIWEDALAAFRKSHSDDPDADQHRYDLARLADDGCPISARSLR